MHIHTIDQEYTYQMKDSIKQLLRDWMKLPSDFDSPEDLMNFVHQKRSEFGEIVVNNMYDWMTDEDWAEDL